MASPKAWAVINVSLGVVALFLVLNLMEVKLPALGKSVEMLESESFCVMKNWPGEFIEREIRPCCLEKAQLTLGCKKGTWYYQDQTLQWQCLTGNGIEYYLNGAGNIRFHCR